MSTTIARKKTAAGAKKKSAAARPTGGSIRPTTGAESGSAEASSASPLDATDVADRTAAAARAAEVERNAELARMADEALALARKTPLARPSVEAFASKYDVDVLQSCATTAFAKAGSHAATVLAFALAAKGARLASTFCAELLGEVESFDHVGPLLLIAADVLEATAMFVDSGRGTWEREIVALLLAGERRGDAKAPDAIVRRARFLVRHDIGPENVLFLGAAVQRLGDPLLSSLGAAHVNKARRNKRIVDDELALLLRAPLDVLAETAQRVTAGYTVKRESPSVGRNDPCPCGSGKKYKKCHAGETTVVDSWEPTPLDPTRLGVEQARNLRASDLLSLDPTRLPVAAQEHAFQRAVDYRLWPAVFAILDATKGSLGARKHQALVLDALSVALEAKEADVAERLLAYLPADATAQDRFEIACIRGEDTLARIEAEALAAIREDADGARGILLASTLLRQFPALGIYVGRGVLHEGRIRDSEAILQRIEDARDRLLVSPFEPWWDVFDTMVDEDGSRREQKKEDAKREKLKDDLRRARAASRKAAAEAAKLQSRVDELDASVVDVPAPVRGEAPKIAAPAPDVTEERRRLKAKIDELQRIIGEGQEERRELRKQLSERDEEGPGPRSKDRVEGPVSRETETDDVDDGDEGDDVAAPRGVSVPRFAERAAKALEDLAPAYAESVLQTVASLAAGKPNAWGGVKQLTKARGVFSARAGIHHRVLFRLEGGGLEVIEVLHRKDLEQVVARLGPRP